MVMVIEGNQDKGESSWFWSLKETMATVMEEAAMPQRREEAEHVAPSFW